MGSGEWKQSHSTRSPFGNSMTEGGELSSSCTNRLTYNLPIRSTTLVYLSETSDKWGYVLNQHTTRCLRDIRAVGRNAPFVREMQRRIDKACDGDGSGGDVGGFWHTHDFSLGLRPSSRVSERTGRERCGNVQG